MVYDIAIIGGGIVGLSTAFQLIEKRPDLNICVLEKENEIAQHQSRWNSGVMHSGIYYKPGSLRARNCHEGHARLVTFCEEYNIPYELCGKIIVATNDREIETLKGIYQKGIQNGLSGLKIISPDEAREIEPHVFCTQAIKVPSAGIVEYEAVAKKYAEIFQNKGGTIFTNHQVQDVIENLKNITLITNNNDITARYVISCAGLYADKITEKTMPDIPYKIIPFRGE